MLTTNISQIVSSIIDKVPFRRKDQRLRISEYILGIFLPKHVNESQIASKVIVSQFWLNFKDQIGLREFVEEMRTLYYLALFKLGLIPLDMDWHVYEFLKPKCIV